MQRFEEGLVAINRAVIATLLAAVLAIVFVNVIGRYGFGSSFAWSEEAARHLMIAGAFCGAGLALREGRLVAIEALQDALPRPFRILLRWIAVAIMLVFMGVMGWLGLKFVGFGWPKETMSTGMSRGIPYMAIPLGCGLFIIHLLLFARRFVDRRFEHDDGMTPDTIPDTVPGTTQRGE